MAALKGLHRARMQFPHKFFSLCDKQVITSALGQLWINFTCIFEVFTKLPLSLLNSGKNSKKVKDLHDKCFVTEQVK